MLVGSNCCSLTTQILQMIGNLSTEIDAKEKYMVAIAPILPHGVKRIKEYILDMVQIDQRNGKWYGV